MEYLNNTVNHLDFIDGYETLNPTKADVYSS
jgi:hypothetical protein